jgi:hypothetical protein
MSKPIVTVAARIPQCFNDKEGAYRMAKPLVIDQMLERAIRATGLDGFGPDTWREGLEILVRDANRVGDRTDMARDAFESDIVRNLTTRLKIINYVRAHPEVNDAPVKRPLVILGLPRTGTTLASNLLAADPARRSLLSWEVGDPIPPPTSESLYTDPRALARLSAEQKANAANPSAGRFYRSSAVYPTECIFLQSHDFKSLYWESHGPLPAYGEWLLQTDMTSAYAYHKLCLQVLQSKTSGIWNLKMPSHALYIRTLVETYPDARPVWTHRDPYTAVGSLCSLIGNAHLGFLGYTDKKWIGSNYPTQAAEHANRVIEFRSELGEDAVYDLHYADLMRDPIDAMRRLYAWAGDDFSAAAEAGMGEWLAENPQGKFGKHEYRLEDYGLTKQALEPLFADYLDKHDVELEG